MKANEIVAWNELYAGRELKWIFLSYEFRKSIVKLRDSEKIMQRMRNQVNYKTHRFHGKSVISVIVGLNLHSIHRREFEFTGYTIFFKQNNKLEFSEWYILDTIYRQESNVNAW